MSHRALLAVLLIGLTLALLGARSAGAADPTLYVHYTMNCTFTIVGDNGAPISVIPPGPYQILITSPQPFAAPDLSGETDPSVACGGSLSFRLTGPGVNLHTTLEDGDAASDQLRATFQSGTYVAQEDLRPTVARLTITVSPGAAGTGVSSGTTSGGGSGGTSTTKSNAASGAASSGGAGLTGLRGTLTGNVSTLGKPTLTFRGKKVSSLKAGRYRLTVLDETGKQGFTIQKLGKPSVKVTGTSFLGRHAVTLTLRAGQWFYYSSRGTKKYFVVTA
jgi:hypothetical protein